MVAFDAPPFCLTTRTAGDVKGGRTMSVVRLPDDPSLEHLRKIAKGLRDAVRAGAPGALAEVAEHHPKGVPDPLSSFSLSAAQLVVARHHDFPSWAKLKHHVELVERYARRPDAVEASPDPATEFLRLACVTYSDGDGPDRTGEARTLLARHPEIVERSVHVAACVANADAVRTLCSHDRSLARGEGGPYGWEPICYLTFSRVDASVTRDAVIDTAHALLDAGADPNAGYLWHGLIPPFTALTGALGEGEQGPRDQPRHPHWRDLARVLLEAGADPNDAQGLYNRQFRASNEHLDLLFEFGLGRGDGGPWKARLGDALESPRELVHAQLSWAVIHGMTDRVRLLVAHGADLATPFRNGHTPAEQAALSGHPSIAEYLVANGAPPPALDPVDAFLAAVISGDRETALALRDATPGLDAQARARRPSLVVTAASNRNADAVRLAVELGFDVNALGRSDVPVEQEWETALHGAVGEGDRELVDVLLSLGADPTIEDTRFSSTALGWAEHFGHADLVARLTPLVDPSP
jgi:hypothetical protein